MVTFRILLGALFRPLCVASNYKMHMFMRRGILAIPVYFEKYPKTTIAGVVLLCVPFVNPYLRRGS